MISRRRAAPAALALALCCTCVERDDGLVVDVSQAHVNFPTTFTTDLGYAVTLTRAYVTVRTVTLRPCESARRWLRGLLEGRAEAHSSVLPGFLDAPSVHDLMAPAGTGSAMGRMIVTDVEQCGVTVLLGPATASARNLPGDESLVGRTLRLEGRYRSPAGEEKPLVLDTAGTSARVRPLERTAIAAEHPVGSLTLTYTGVAAWFDGLDLDAITPSETADIVLRRAADAIIASLTAR